MTYTKEHPPVPSADELRARIHGWGVDLDPNDRPSVPQEKYDPEATGAHWDFPERQPEKWPRERSVEHKFLTPVFGTSTPPRGLSGAIRRYSYRKYSEGRAAHWLLLVLADRVDAAENHVRSMASLRPDNPITETGILAEFSHHGPSTRIKTKRVDRYHTWMDPFIVAGPWLLPGLFALRALRKRTRRRRR